MLIRTVIKICQNFGVYCRQYFIPLSIDEDLVEQIRNLITVITGFFQNTCNVTSHRTILPQRTMHRKFAVATHNKQRIVDSLSQSTTNNVSWIRCRNAQRTTHRKFVVATHNDSLSQHTNLRCVNTLPILHLPT